jgi:tellurite methyltransferase
MTDGGYDIGYKLVSCFWGDEPSSLVKSFLSMGHPSGTALDLGCGEGKNAVALANAGYAVEAVDCSGYAISSAKQYFGRGDIDWVVSDVLQYSPRTAEYDLVVAYGLAHCLSSQHDIELLISKIKHITRRGGHNIICAFNDRSHDLSAHPGFNPTLLSHEFYSSMYADWHILQLSDANLYEVHPHNNIPHHHSLSRLLAERPVDSRLSP